MFWNVKSNKNMKKKNESQLGAVHVLIDGKPVWLDLENLRDDELCMRTYDGSPAKADEEHYFTWENAQLAAKKQGKRIFTIEEWEAFYGSFTKRRWDENLNLIFLTFKRVEGGTVDIPLKPAGSRSHNDKLLYRKNYQGRYWSSSPSTKYKEVSSIFLFERCPDEFGTCPIFCFDPDYYLESVNSGLTVRCVRDSEPQQSCPLSKCPLLKCPLLNEKVKL
jgi:hypothetical protein